MAKLLSNNTSGVHGMRLRRRQVVTRAGTPRERLVIDLYWRCDGRVRATSVEVTGSPLQATERALAKRYEYTGDQLHLTPRQAWLRLRASLPPAARG